MKPLTASLVLFLALAGCQSAKVANPLTQQIAGNDPQSQLDFWHTLAGRAVTSNDEAFHALLLYTDGQDPAGSYEQRVETLKGRKMLPPGFNAPADHAVTRGDLAVAIARILEVRGGLMLRLAPRSPRYATREMVFIELYPPSAPHQTFSGTEFLGIMGRVEDFQRGDASAEPAVVLPSEIKSPATRPAAG